MKWILEKSNIKSFRTLKRNFGSCLENWILPGSWQESSRLVLIIDLYPNVILLASLPPSDCSKNHSANFVSHSEPRFECRSLIHSYECFAQKTGPEQAHFDYKTVFLFFKYLYFPINCSHCYAGHPHFRSCISMHF